ncbi:MAG: glutamate synthase [Clostridia bacterium]|nr:glutamate synthase [Clostridia bacterium]
MLRIDCTDKHFSEIGKLIRETAEKQIMIDNAQGHRYIASGVGGKEITINGTPGNAMGAYLDGCKIVVNGSAQDAIGDTMNDGLIVIHGNSGDATGYSMRGGKIFIKGNAGYRAGIHMKAYKDKFPVLVIGGKAGSFLGEYQAGGIILVLGIDTDSKTNVGFFTGNGMHGGKIILRSEQLPDLPEQISARKANAQDLKEIEQYVNEYCGYFGNDPKEIMSKDFFVLTANSANPYKQLYTSV